MNMENLQIEITHLERTTDTRHSNAYLAHGWRLLKVLVRRDEDEYPEFILGWPRDGKPVYPTMAELR